MMLGEAGKSFFIQLAEPKLMCSRCNMRLVVKRDLFTAAIAYFILSASETSPWWMERTRKLSVFQSYRPFHHLKAIRFSGIDVALSQVMCKKWCPRINGKPWISDMKLDRTTKTQSKVSIGCMTVD